MSRPDLIHSPVAKWTRKLTLIQKEDPELYRAIVNHPRMNQLPLIEEEIAFRHELCGRNLVVQIQGPTGSGKSAAGGLRLCKMLHPKWTPKGRTFYTNDDVLYHAKRAAEPTVLFKDEDPREHGQGTENVSDMVRNIETACARFHLLDIVVVNPEATSHMADIALDFSREESRRDGKKLLSAVADISAWTKDEDSLERRPIKIGKAEFEVPEELMPAYKNEMVKFKNALLISGGRGITRDVYARYEDLIPVLQRDEKFQRIPTTRDGYFTQRHCRRLSSKYGVGIEEADTWLVEVWDQVYSMVKISPELK